MRMRLAGCSCLSVLFGFLLLNSGNAQLFFDPATYSFGGRGALTHALENGPRLPRFFYSAPPPPPSSPAAAAAAPSYFTPAEAEPSTSDAASPTSADVQQEPSFFMDPGASGTTAQMLDAVRRSEQNALALSSAQANQSTGPTAGPAAAPAVVPSTAPSEGSFVKGSHSTQIKDLLKPAPPVPPALTPASPAPAPVQAPPAQTGAGQPEAGRGNGGGQSCDQQGLQGHCNACICCCSPKGSGGFVDYHPEGCECKRRIRTSDVWLTLVMSAVLILPALLMSSWFAGLYSVSPYREMSLDTGL